MRFLTAIAPIGKQYTNQKADRENNSNKTENALCNRIATYISRTGGWAPQVPTMIEGLQQKYVIYSNGIV